MGARRRRRHDVYGQACLARTVPTVPWYIGCRHAINVLMVRAGATQIEVGPTALPRLLTVREVATELGLKESRVRQLIQEGALVARKFGNQTRLLRSQVQAYIEQRYRPTSGGGGEKPDPDTWLRSDEIPSKEDAVAAARRWATCALGHSWRTRP